MENVVGYTQTEQHKHTNHDHNYSSEEFVW